MSDTEYKAGFDLLLLGTTTYRDFIVPQLSRLLVPLSRSRTSLSVLEIGPGPKSILGSLPDHLRQRIKRFTAFERNGLFSAELEQWLRATPETEPPFPCLKHTPDIRQRPFILRSSTACDDDAGASETDEKFDVVLFCHSMYDMNRKAKVIEQALEMLAGKPEGAMVVVFHRDGTFHVDGLVCHQTASFPTGAVCVPDDDDVLDCFNSFIVGYAINDADEEKVVRAECRKLSRAMARHDETRPNHLFFSSNEIMVAFTKHATALPEPTARVPVLEGDKVVKNREARHHHPAAVIKPTDVSHIQECVQWAVRHGVGLTIVGGGHSGHCIWPNVVAVDMGSFDRVHILDAWNDRGGSGSSFECMVVAEAGSTTGEVIRKTTAAGVTVPLGSRPSVGSGLWLQGGIGHLTRSHGLTCDAIVGAVLVSVDSGKVLYIGCVPSEHRPAGAIRPGNEVDLMWAIKGAGTNFGIVVSVTFKAFKEPIYSYRNWTSSFSDKLETRRKLADFDNLIAGKLPRNCSADAYLYWEADKLNLGVTIFESSTTARLASRTHLSTPGPWEPILGPEYCTRTTDPIGLFEAEMYMAVMHGGHAGGKTSSFKRCLFLKHISSSNITDVMLAAIETRPTPFCYLHLLHGGGAIHDVPANATAFGCRDWDFACVVTGIWPRDQDGTELARAAVAWVYKTAGDLLPLCNGVYSADLGPDPRDAVLAARTFGSNRQRLVRLKHNLDPHNVLAYTCPLKETPVRQKLIVLVTGECGTAKDYCADIWASAIMSCTRRSLVARAVSITT